MAHEIAKLLLEHAETFLERTEAIKAALSLGMPLAEIEAYLDWLDAVRGQPRDGPTATLPDPPSQPAAPGPSTGQAETTETSAPSGAEEPSAPARPSELPPPVGPATPP